MDIYYHILAAWGFIQAGGYSGWDFWQYAPAGRINIYPPVFHMVLSILMKLGISTVILAKFFETIMPVVFLIVLWNFVRKNYNDRLAFFTILTFSSSFSFYVSLIDHIPATLALIFVFLALDQLFQKNYLRSLLLLALCFYTHIGISWFFAFSFLIYGLFNREYRKIASSVFISALILSLPILFKQLISLKVISTLGFKLKERYLCQIKIIDYLLALFGLILAFKADTKYRLFLSLFLASLIFLIYPYRFFSAEGYLPIIFLSALALNSLYEKFKTKAYIKYLSVLAVFFILFISPTVFMQESGGGNSNSPGFKLRLFDSAFIGMLFAKGESIWFPQEYLSASILIKNNSGKGDIIYSSLNIAGVALAGVSGRATANALLPEIKPSRQFDPVAAAKIIIFTQDDDHNMVNHIVSSYNLIKIGQNKIFILYKNPFCHKKVDIKKASVPFWEIGLIAFIFIFLFSGYKKCRKFI